MKDNKFMPEGGFEGNSTYQYNYLEKDFSPNQQVKP